MYHKTSIIEIPIYETKVKITLVDSMYNYFKLKNYTYQKHWKKEEIEGIRALVANTNDYKVKYNYDVIFHINSFGLDALAHEVFHLTKYIMEYIGTTLSDDSEEAWAYLTGYLFETIRKEIKELIRNKDAD